MSLSPNEGRQSVSRRAASAAKYNQGIKSQVSTVGGRSRSPSVSTANLNAPPPRPAPVPKKRDAFQTEEDFRKAIAARKMWHKGFQKTREMILGANMFASALNRSPANLAARLKGTEDQMAIQIRSILTKARGSRTEDDMLFLDRTLVRISPSLAALSFDVRSKMYDTMTYEFHPKGVLLSRPGVTVESVYYLIAGGVEESRISAKTGKKKVDVKFPGSQLGAITKEELVREGGGLRKVELTCITNSDFVRLRIDDYSRAVFSHDGGSIDNKVTLVNGLRLFQEAPERILTHAVSTCSIVHLAPSQPIIEEDAINRNIYFICKGACRVSKTIRFIKKAPPKRKTDPVVQGPNGGTGRDKKPVDPMKFQPLLPWAPGVSVKSDDEVLDHRMVFIELQPGDTFPELPIARPLPDPIERDQREFVPSNLSRAELQRVLPDAPNYVTIEAHPDHPETVLIAIPIVDFIGFANHHMVHTVVACGRRTRVSVPLLQEAFLESSGVKALDGGISVSTKQFEEVLSGLMKRYKDMNYTPDAVPLEATKMVKAPDGDPDEMVAKPKARVNLDDDDPNMKPSVQTMAAFKVGNLS
ncbi:hypothetical protein HK101_003124 [Irineochytrium annulatum]|nr:hypothetical protein HK101_003124 [Irineochytrium annulatum]